MVIYHLDDGREMTWRVTRNAKGKVVREFVPAAEEIARLRAIAEAKTAKPKPKAEPSPKPPPKPSLTPVEATLILARRGRKEILPKLREILDKSPELWKHFGDLTKQTQENWLRLLSGKDLYLLESVRRHLDEMRSQLAGPSASPLEKLLVDRLLACHVEVLYFEAIEAQQLNGDNPKLTQFRLQRQEQANRQFLLAAKTLATVRQLQSRTVILGVVQQQPAPVTPIESILAGPINGEQLPKTGGKDREATGTADRTASRINGYDRIAGNRVADLQEVMAGK